MKKLTALALSIALFLTGCTGPSAQQYINAGIATLNDLSILPNLTPTDRAWLTAASAGFTCSSSVVAKGESKLQTGIDIAACFANLPVVPSGDQLYIQAGFVAVDIFVALFAAQTPAGVSAQTRVGKYSADSKATYMARVKAAPPTIKK